MAELYQVILVARDVERMASFYRDVMGMRITYPEHPTNLSRENWVTLDGGQCTLAIHGGGEIRGSGSVILSFRVKDLDYVYWDLKNRGVPVDPPREVSEGVRSAQARDPEGNTVSLEEVRLPVV